MLPLLAMPVSGRCADPEEQSDDPYEMQQMYMAIVKDELKILHKTLVKSRDTLTFVRETQLKLRCIARNAIQASPIMVKVGIRDLTRNLLAWEALFAPLFLSDDWSGTGAIDKLVDAVKRDMLRIATVLGLATADDSYSYMLNNL